MLSCSLVLLTLVSLAASGAATLPTEAAGRRAAQAKPLPERVPPREEAAPTTGEVPKSVLDPILDDVVKRTGAERVALQLLRAEETVFADGSLGCARPGDQYTQAQVAGYRIVIRHAKKDYDYRATRRGFFLLCERPKAGLGGHGVPR